MKLKILFISHYSELYGANRSLLTLLIHIKEKFEILVLVPGHGNFSDELEKNNIEYYITPNLFNNYFLWNTENNILIRIFIFFKSLIRFLFAKIYIWLWLVPKLKKFSPFSYVYSNSSVILLGYTIASKLKIKHVHHLREQPKLDYGINYFWSEKKIKEKIRNKSTHVIAISKQVFNYFDLRGSNCHVIYNGFSTNKSVRNKDFPKNRINILMVGLILETKGQRKTIVALSNFLLQNPKFHLNIVGGNEDQLVSIIDSLGLQKSVTLHGFQKNTEKYYEEADIFIMPSLYEAFGRVTVEAISYGIPVLGLKGQNATSEIITDKFNGILVDHFEDFSKGIELILSDNYSSMSQNAITSAKKFSVKNYVEPIIELLT